MNHNSMLLILIVIAEFWDPHNTEGMRPLVTQLSFNLTLAQNALSLPTDGAVNAGHIHLRHSLKNLAPVAHPVTLRHLQFYLPLVTQLVDCCETPFTLENRVIVFPLGGKADVTMNVIFLKV